ncbi:carbon monoxide dehydrogenase [Prosthecomicrobium hirschii]|uniref:Carbon monoxide dehydrogenase n=1 Tax=Prosthecodimorpha hirschii TaxID=665126 RepID=A0A0P6VU38_9HYPH|nr:xanthine dehydrogenase family protein molybdopterin-binding subunit [Prosthecomicrobium hirschii]KPL54776.1 carbon monoxide dehydrogenase [Prosthecomicrobium hirschii]
MTEMKAPAKFGLGASAQRIEDPHFVTGRGRYTSDITPAGTLYGYVLRAQMAHARFTLSGVDDAREAPGVHLVLTGEDVEDLGHIPCRGLVRQVDGKFPWVPPRPVLNLTTVRHVGDPIAFVVADTVEAARSAAEAIDVDYVPLDVAVETRTALDPATPVVWPEKGTNLAFDYFLGDKDKTDAAFAAAARTVALEVVNNRLVVNYMETRAAIGEYDADTDRYTLIAGTQGGHGMRDALARPVLKIAPSQLRVITPDVGGGFGIKTFVFSEYPLVLVAAKKLGRPVKWVGDRTEHFIGDAQGRDNITTGELALDADGRIIGYRVDLTANMGAYLNQYGPFIPWVGVTMSTGLYDIPALAVSVKGVFTNTLPVDAYRGAGRPEAAYLIERLMDVAAHDLGLTPEEFRRRNFVATLPYTTATGRSYDTGDFAGHMDAGLAAADYAGFPARLAASKAAGKIRGLGFATYIEACAFPGSEEANVVLNPDGGVTLFIGTQTNGQGHATAYGQIIAGYLGIDIAQVKTVQGDTDLVANGGGTGGSRSIPLGAASVDIAAKVLVEKIKELAATELETSAGDLELVDGAVRIVGTDRSISLADVARAAPDEDSRKGYGKFVQDECTYPNGTHVCEVEIDPETGKTDVVGYTIVDDFGVTVNPLLLAGQVHGGVVQGLGQALIENTVYDATGQLLTASFMDYGMPRADDVPSIAFQTRNIPSTTNMLGIKGAGEAGTIGATPAVANAVNDALWRAYGIRHLDMPLTPLKVWEAIRAAG